MREVRRVLRPEGVLLLTTPNRLYPFEPHTGLYGPHYLPLSLADRYIRWRNPSFLQEYPTYGEIHLLTPWQMKGLLENAGLRLIPEFPGGLPLATYAPVKRFFLRLLCAAGLGWFAPVASGFPLAERRAGISFGRVGIPIHYSLFTTHCL